MNLMKCFGITLLCVVVIGGLASTAVAGDPCPLDGGGDCTNCEFMSADMSVLVGDTNQVLVVRGVHDICVLGFSVGLQADTSKIELTGVALAGAIGEVDFEDGGVSTDGSKVIYGVVFDLTKQGFASKNLPPGDDALLEVTYDVVTGSATTATVDFAEVLIPDVSSEPARNIMTNVQGFTIDPALNAGTITIEDPQPVIDSVAPGVGEPGTVVDIAGGNFDQANLQVTICGNAAAIQNSTATTIQVTAPDCDVDECTNVVVSTVAGSATETEGFCYGCVASEPGEELNCNDGIDNDCDGPVDGEDLDCCVASEPGGEELNCDDGLDNDCDGNVDDADDDCDCVVSEDPEANCTDGLDNDCDGNVDDADDDCDCVVSEDPEANCTDGVDNDCDGTTDGADSDCDGEDVGPFLRGDCDGNGRFGGTPTEAIVGLEFSFRGGPEPRCLAACDAEANGSLAITDYLRILRSAFLGQGEPDAPFPDCTTSTKATDLMIGCITATACP